MTGRSVYVVATEENGGFGYVPYKLPSSGAFGASVQ